VGLRLDRDGLKDRCELGAGLFDVWCGFIRGNRAARNDNDISISLFLEEKAMFEWLIIGGGVHGTFFSHYLTAGAGVARAVASA
jgi:hypothetical protein